VEELYDLSSTVVTSGALLYLLMHPVFTIPANITIDKYGIRKSIILGSVLQIIGSAMRILVNKSFLFVIFGYTIAGIGRPFIVNAQGKIVGEWFFP
jgi:FLVCR family feline leukemia virus subgroup C receptor-related protein